MTDWTQIKTEYVTTQTSYRKLARKFGVGRGALELRAKREHWVLLRRQAQQSAALQQKAVQAQQSAALQQEAGQAQQSAVQQQKAGQAQQSAALQQEAGQAQQSAALQQEAGQAQQPTAQQQATGEGTAVSRRMEQEASAVRNGMEAARSAAPSPECAQRSARLQGVADKLLSKISAAVDALEDVDTQAFKRIAGILRDIKDIQMIRSEAEMREQEARIAHLTRQAERDAADGALRVVLEGVLSDYAQ